MNPIKREKYILDGFVHTLSATSIGLIEEIPEPYNRQLSKTSSRKKGDFIITTSKINPNHRKDGNVLKYSDLQDELEKIFHACGVENWEAVRYDFCMNSYDPEHYESFLKLNRFVVSMIAFANEMENTYITHDLWEVNRVRSMAVKNSRVEVEVYDKKIESAGQDPAYSRLEIRSTRMAGEDPIHEFLDTWFIRLDCSLNAFNDVQARYNYELEKIYRSQKDAVPTRFCNIREFVMQYQDVIFTRRQLTDFLAKFPDEVQNPELCAKNYKARYGFEFFSRTDVQKVFDEIKRNLTDYFSR